METQIESSVVPSTELKPLRVRVDLKTHPARVLRKLHTMGSGVVIPGDPNAENEEDRKDKTLYVSVLAIKKLVNHGVKIQANRLSMRQVRAALKKLKEKGNYVREDATSEDMWCITASGNLFFEENYGKNYDGKPLMDKPFSSGRKRSSPLPLDKVVDKRQRVALVPPPKVTQEKTKPTTPAGGIVMGVENIQLTDVAHAMRFDVTIPACAFNAARKEHVRQLDAVRLIALYNEVAKNIALLYKACT